jgi:hypothetical protein
LFSSYQKTFNHSVDATILTPSDQLSLSITQANVSIWLAQELSDDHWLNVNNDTKEDLSLGLSSDI